MCDLEEKYIRRREGVNGRGRFFGQIKRMHARLLPLLAVQLASFLKVEGLIREFNLIFICR